MKKLSSIMAVIATAIMLSSCAFTRVGDLTMMSSRNFYSKSNYKLIQKYVVGSAKSNRGDALQSAINDAVKKIPDGEFLKNVRVYVKNNGKEIRVEGDVWGTTSFERKLTKYVDENTEFGFGDKVVFKQKNGKIIEATIIGLNQNTAIIEYKGAFGKYIKKELEYNSLVKVQ